MRRTERYVHSLIVALSLFCSQVVLAQAPEPEPEEPTPVTGELERPQLLEDSPPVYPREAMDAQEEADVTVWITVSEEGQVVETELTEAHGFGFDEAALSAARGLRFSPARVGGVPTPVKIRYTFRFRLPEKQTQAAALPECAADCPTDERRKSKLQLTVFERGKGKRLAGVEVYVLDEDRVYLTDDNGELVLELVPGAYALTIRPPGFYPFETTERLEEDQAVSTEYYVRRHRRERYKTIVWADKGRTEVARTSLADDEIRVIPGTFGDPIRVAMVLPGVSAAVSGLSYPIIRGALPGDSLYEIDGIPVPMLYHLLFGTAVIHPRFTDEITFQPGGYAADSGRFPGGKISARTARSTEDATWVADASILALSLFRAQPIGDDSEVVAAVRYGTLGLIVEGLAANIVFRYWDYQLRAAHRFDTGGQLTLTLLGAGDVAGELDEMGNEDVLRTGFHRADLRFRQAVGDGWFTVGTQVGNEWFVPGSSDGTGEVAGDARENMVRPYAEVGVELGEHTQLRGGGDILVQDFSDVSLGDLRLGVMPDSGLTLGAWLVLDLAWRKLTVTPSFRVDHYRFETGFGMLEHTSYDPRLSAAYAIHDRITLKAAAGVYHGPPRLSVVEPPIVFGPVPALGGIGAVYGLNRSLQTSAGVETELPWDLEASVTGFFHDNEHAVDFAILGQSIVAPEDPCAGPASRAPTVSTTGETVGGELLLRRRLGNQFFGWVAYTASRSRRQIPGVGEFPFDFDQTHVLNVVGSWDVGRNWTLGAVFHASTGRPRTPQNQVRCPGGPGVPDFPELVQGRYNSARFPNYWRVDFRMQKREVYPTWYFDFYIDVFNVLFQWETVEYDYNFDGQSYQEEPVDLPLFLPSIGVRGEF